MKRILSLFLVFVAFFAIAQKTPSQYKTDTYNNIRTQPYSPTRAGNQYDNAIDASKSFYVDGTASGTNTYAVTITNTSVTSYVTGQWFVITFTNANSSTTVTLNVTPSGGSALGALAIKDNSGSDPAVGDIKAGGAYLLHYNGTNLRIIGAAGGGGGGDFWALTGTSTLLDNTVIDGGGFNLDFRNIDVLKLGTSAQPLTTLETNSTGIIHNTDGGGVTITDSGNLGFATIDVSSSTGNGLISLFGHNLALTMGGSSPSAVFNDSRTVGNTAGIEYAFDYSAGFTNRSLVDKEYVDNAIAAGGVSDGDKGDITVSSSGTVWTIDNTAVTFAKLQNSAGAGLSVIGRSTNSAGSFEEVAAGTDAHVLRRSGTSLGFGTIGDASISALAWSKLTSIPTTLSGYGITDAAGKYFTANRQTASYQLMLTDADTKIVEMNVASPNNLTIPANSTVAFPVGTSITIVQYGTGLTSIVAGGGVTIRSSSGALASPGQYSPMVIEKIATDEWYLWNGTPTLVGQALTKTDDTNITLTLGGSPASSLLAATSLTLGWTGTLGATRGGTGIGAVTTGDIIYGSAANTWSVRNIFNTTPTAYLHFKSGTSTANNAPLKFTSGNVNVTAEAGAVEFNGNFYATKGSALRAGIGGVIFDFFSDANNTGTTETDLYSYTTPASTLNINGDKIKAEFSGLFNDVTSTGQLKVVFAGTTIGDTGVLTISSTGAWSVEVMIIRTNTTTARSVVKVNTPGASTATYTNQVDLTSLVFTNTNILKITGTAGGAGGGNNDITAKLSTGWFFPAAQN